MPSKKPSGTRKRKPPHTREDCYARITATGCTIDKSGGGGHPRVYDPDGKFVIAVPWSTGPQQWKNTWTRFKAAIGYDPDTQE